MLWPTRYRSRVRCGLVFTVFALLLYCSCTAETGSHERQMAVYLTDPGAECPTGEDALMALQEEEPKARMLVGPVPLSRTEVGRTCCFSGFRCRGSGVEGCIYPYDLQVGVSAWSRSGLPDDECLLANDDGLCPTAEELAERIDSPYWDAGVLSDPAQREPHAYCTYLVVW